MLSLSLLKTVNDPSCASKARFPSLKTGSVPFELASMTTSAYLPAPSCVDAGKVNQLSLPESQSCQPLRSIVFADTLSNSMNSSEFSGIVLPSVSKL